MEPNEMSEAVSKKRWAIHLAILMIFPLLALVHGKQAPDQPILSHGAAGLLLACAFQLAITAVIFGAAWLASRASADSLLLRPQGWQLAPLLGVAYSVVIRLTLAMVAVTVLIFAQAAHLVSEPELKGIGESIRPKVERLVDMDAVLHDRAYLILNLTLVSFIIGGLREELWRAGFLAGLRRVFPNTFSGTGGGVFAAFIAAIFFGLGHLPQGAVPALILGLVGFALGIIMVVHRSTWVAALTHGFFDATSFGLFFVIAQYGHLPR